MKPHCCLLLLMTSLSVALAAEEAASQPKKILMVGNSMTYTYGLPEMLAQLAASKGRELKVESHVMGGKALKWHLTEGPKGQLARDRILQGGYDTIILQDGARSLQRPGGSDEMEAAVGEFDKIIREAGSRMFLYATLVRSPHPTQKSVDRVMDTHTRLAQQYHVPCAPVALAFQRFASLHGEIALLDDETAKRYALNQKGTHPSPFGSYLAACTLYSALFDQSPEGSTYRHLPTGTEISAEDAALAQKIAWETWKDYQPTITTQTH